MSQGPLIGAPAIDSTAWPDESMTSRHPARIVDEEPFFVGRLPTITKGGKVNDPLGLAIAPNGDILAANGGNGNLVEITPSGQQVAVRTLDTTAAPPAPKGSGALFGFAVAPAGNAVYYVDDAVNTLRLLH